MWIFSIADERLLFFWTKQFVLNSISFLSHSHRKKQAFLQGSVISRSLLQYYKNEGPSFITLCHLLCHSVTRYTRGVFLNGVLQIEKTVFFGTPLEEHLCGTSLVLNKFEYLFVWTKAKLNKCDSVWVQKNEQNPADSFTFGIFVWLVLPL